MNRKALGEFRLMHISFLRETLMGETGVGA